MMFDYSNSDPEICIVGRTAFHTGIGQHTYAFAEMLARSYKVCIRSTDGWPHEVSLPNGRLIPKWNGGAVAVSIFVDVIKNGTHDHNIELIPESRLKIACLVWDSDQLPSDWVEILNGKFDLVVCLSPHLIRTAENSGVKIPLVCVPLGLDLGKLLKRPFRPRSKRIRIGSIAAFHPRKNTDLAIECFLGAFAKDDSVELYIHSNLGFEDTVANIKSRILDFDARNVIISTNHIEDNEKISLIESFDLFLNLSRGEGYSIGPREALALGKPVLLSNVGGHQELAGTPGVFLVEPEINVPARFPEIDNLVFGSQMSVRRHTAGEQLRLAVEYLNTPACFEDAAKRRKRAADFSFDRLAPCLAGLLSPQVLEFRKSRCNAPEVRIQSDARQVIKSKLGLTGGLKTSKRLVQMHDGGFFSIFNAFFSHLVWDLKDDRCHAVLPDWDVGRFLMRFRNEDILSFCYGNPEDGNIWTKLYKPLFGLDASEMQSEEFLYRDAFLPRTRHNEDREPLLTYVNAAQLYREPWFPKLRKEYNKVFEEHIKLEGTLNDSVNEFIANNMRGYTVVGAHVRHPSHTVEQPNAVIANADQYIDRIKDIAATRRLGEANEKWRVFLATDQDRVIRRFRQVFGDRLIVWEAARRTTDAEDKIFDSLTNKNVDGYQLQHLIAKNRSAWSVERAREVIRDAHLMAQCDTLLHVVSNVSTAVSYINPRCELLFMTH